VAYGLLDTIKAERLVLDWKKKQQARAAVQQTIEIVLEKLPTVYTTDPYQEKCGAIYQRVYDTSLGAGKSLFSQTG
jgi:type I restriction enzyme R subunit